MSAVPGAFEAWMAEQLVSLPDRERRWLTSPSWMRDSSPPTAARERLATTNPAVHLALVATRSWPLALLVCIEQGATPDEIEAGGWIELLPTFTERHFVRDALAWLRGEASTTFAGSRSEPIATPAAANAAYSQLRSERKAARAIGVSRTQLRRLIGKDQPTDH